MLRAEEYIRMKQADSDCHNRSNVHAMLMNFCKSQELPTVIASMNLTSSGDRPPPSARIVSLNRCPVSLIACCKNS